LVTSTGYTVQDMYIYERQCERGAEGIERPMEGVEALTGVMGG
jgi:hypothetical protein